MRLTCIRYVLISVEQTAASRAFVKIASRLPVFLPLLLIISLLTAITHGEAQTLINGSFENPATTNSYAGAGDGWTTTGNASVNNSSSYNTGRTPYGDQYLRLLGFVNPTSGMVIPATASQTIGSGFIIGNTYRLTLSGVSASSLQSSQLGISVSGGANAGLNAMLPAQGQNPPPILPFVDFSLDFTVTTNAPVTITFNNSLNTGAIIDNVNLVPEPSTWAAMLVGVVVLGGTWRCRGCRRA